MSIQIVAGQSFTVSSARGPIECVVIGLLRSVVIVSPVDETSVAQTQGRQPVTVGV